MSTERLEAQLKHLRQLELGESMFDASELEMRYADPGSALVGGACAQKFGAAMECGGGEEECKVKWVNAWVCYAQQAQLASFMPWYRCYAGRTDRSRCEDELGALLSDAMGHYRASVATAFDLSAAQRRAVRRCGSMLDAPDDVMAVRALECSLPIACRPQTETFLRCVTEAIGVDDPMEVDPQQPVDAQRVGRCRRHFKDMMQCSQDFAVLEWSCRVRDALLPFIEGVEGKA